MRKNEQLEEVLLMQAALQNQPNGDPQKAYAETLCIQDMLQIQRTAALLPKNRRLKSYRSMQDLLETRLGDLVEEMAEIDQQAE